MPHWSPNMLRHARATEINGMGCLEDALGVLGHDDAKTTARYARQSIDLKALESAARAMRKVG